MNHKAENLTFSCDTMGLLHEIADHGLPHTAGVLKIPLNIFKNLLAMVAQRAIELDDPQLNILMLRLKLYEVVHSDILNKIAEQGLRIKKLQKKDVPCTVGNIPAEKDTLILIQEISTWEYLAGTLTQDHQQGVRFEIMSKVDAMKHLLKEREHAANLKPE
jgi:hypothetical protein